MRLFLFAVIELTIVTLVYRFAYRAGYNASQSKAAAIVHDFSTPVTELLDQLSETVDKAIEEKTTRNEE